MPFDLVVCMDDEFHLYLYSALGKGRRAKSVQFELFEEQKFSHLLPQRTKTAILGVPISELDTDKLMVDSSQSLD